MATVLGALANIAAEYSDSEFETDNEEEKEIVEYEKDGDFIKECILGLVIKESVRRVEYAKSIKYRNNQPNEIQITDSSSPASSTVESSSDDSSSESDTEGLIIVSNKEASQSLKKGSKCNDYYFSFIIIYKEVEIYVVFTTVHSHTVGCMALWY